MRTCGQVAHSPQLAIAACLHGLSAGAMCFERHRRRLCSVTSSKTVLRAASSGRRLIEQGFFISERCTKKLVEKLP